MRQKDSVVQRKQKNTSSNQLTEFPLPFPLRYMVHWLFIMLQRDHFKKVL